MIHCISVLPQINFIGMSQIQPEKMREQHGVKSLPQGYIAIELQ